MFASVFLVTSLMCAQGISVASQSFSPQQLIEDVLIDNACIENVTVTNSVSGNLPGSQRSFGYFSRNGTDFPFENGIVLSTGSLSNVPGPNTSLSDDNADGWNGDADLENNLGLEGTLNATIIEFDFIPNANAINFRYIFASEEYQEGDPSTCEFSDSFAFLIRKAGTQQYENIALVPGTDIPVQVTTVHSGIPNACDPVNEEYFGSFNGENVPINFNGQTSVLEAETMVEAGTGYHIKLVIADEQNYRYDSAVFLEGGSFNLNADLGEDRVGNLALCPGEEEILRPTNDFEQAVTNYNWFKLENNSENLISNGAETDSLVVSEAGRYRVEVTFENGCTASDNVEVDFIEPPQTDFSFSQCDTDGDGNVTFDVNMLVASELTGNPNWQIAGFYNAQNQGGVPGDPIDTPENFILNSDMTTLYVELQSQSGCAVTRPVILGRSTGTTIDAVNLVSCYNAQDSVEIDLTTANAAIEAQLGTSGESIGYFENEEGALNNENGIDAVQLLAIENLPKTVYARVNRESACSAIGPVNIGVIQRPEFDPDYRPSLCLNENESIELEAGLINGGENLTYEWQNGAQTQSIQVDTAGLYTVTITKSKIFNGENFSCSFERSITVTGSSAPQVEYAVIGDVGNFKVRIEATGEGDYQYAIDDGGTYSNDSVIPVSAGEHTLYVKDNNGCGQVQKDITVLGYMKFFTPNQDAVNDVWRLLGIEPYASSIDRVEIYDRYGKLLRAMSVYNQWDGNYHGKPMPSNDYWFVVSFNSGRVFKGNFTLKR